MSLVPLADIFNHKAAVVSLSGDYQIQPTCFGDEADEDGASSAADSETCGPQQPGLLSFSWPSMTSAFLACLHEGCSGTRMHGLLLA